MATLTEVNFNPFEDTKTASQKAAAVPQSNIYVDKVTSAYPGDYDFKPPPGFEPQKVITGFDTRTGSPIYAGGEGVQPLRPKETISSIARPLLEAGGSVAGTMIAAPGLITSVAGGALGYGIGAEAADLLDQYLGLAKADSLPEELKEAGKRVVIGTAMEMGGQVGAQVVGTVLKAGKGLIRKLPALTPEGAQLRAGEVLAAHTSSGPVIAKNVEEAALLEQEIPGLKFSKGALTDDPEFIKFERAQERGPYGFAPESLEAKRQNTEAITNYINKVKGKAGLEDVRKPAEATRGELGKAISAAEAGLELETVALGRGMGPQETGETVRGIAKGKAAAAKGKAGKLFEDVPDIDIDASSIITKIDELSEPMSKFENVEKNVPASFGKTKELLEETGGKATPQDLQGLRSELTEDIRDIKGSASPNNRQVARLNKLVSEIDDVLDTASPVDEDIYWHGVGPKGKFKEFRKDLIGTSSGNLGHYGEGIYLTDTEGKAKAFSEFVGGTGETLPVKLDMKKPFIPTEENLIGLAEKHNLPLPEKEVVAIDYNDLYSKINKADKVSGDLLKFLKEGDYGKAWDKLNKKYSRAEQNSAMFDLNDIGDYFEATKGKRHQGGVSEYIVEELKSKGISPKLISDFSSDIRMDYMTDLGQNTGPITKALKAEGYDSVIAGDEYMVLDPAQTKIIGDPSEAASQLKEARTAWKKEYIEKFKQGTVGDILKKGPDGADKVQSGQIAGRFFKPGVAGMDAADDFLKAIGDDPKAMEAIRDYVRQDMIASAKNPTTGEITASGLNRWKAKYKRALDKYGFTKEFDTIENARTQLDQAVTAQAEFEKSAAAKLLDADPLKAVQSALSKGSKATAAHDLMRKIADDPMAVAGLQNAMIDHILTKEVGELKTIAKMDALIKEYDPALRVIFEANPKKYEAIKTVRKAIRTMGRTDYSPLGKGSDTTENTMAIVAKEGGMAAWKIAGVVRAAMAPFKELSEANINKYINRAILDPDYARTLTMMAKGVDEAVIESRLKSQFAKIGIMAFRGKEKKPAKKAKQKMQDFKLRTIM